MSGIYTTPGGQQVHDDGKPIGHPPEPNSFVPAPGSTDNTRTRIIAIAVAAEEHPRFSVRRCDGSILILLDGYDTASVDGTAMSYCSQRMELAEYILGIRSNAKLRTPNSELSEPPSNRVTRDSGPEGACASGHVFAYAGQPPGGLIPEGWPCVCGQTVLRYTTCEHCGSEYSKAVPRETGPQESTAEGALAAMKVIVENFTPPGYTQRPPNEQS